MATDVKVLTAESSPTDILASLSPAENKKWRETGEIPDREVSPKESKTENAESSTAAKTDVTEPTEKTAEESSSASVTEKPESKGKVVKNAATRIPELLSEIKRLNAELEVARKAPASAAPKSEEIQKPRRTDVDEKTGQPKYATDDDFLDARDKYVAELSSKQTRADIAKEESSRRVAEQNRILQEKWQNSLKIAIEAHPDFAKVCEIDDKGAFQSAELKKIKSGGSLDRFCLDTARGGDVLYYLAKHTGEVDRIQAIDSLDEITEALVDLKKQSLATSAPTQPEKKEEKPEGSKAKVTGAPAPAASVSGRATAPVDEQAAAIAAGDQRRYMKAANEEEFRNRKKG